MVNKKIFFEVLLVVFLISVVSAACAGGNTQIIMKLSGPENAHGALWNDGNYIEDICYDAIFGELDIIIKDKLA